MAEATETTATDQSTAAEETSTESSQEQSTPEASAEQSSAASTDAPLYKEFVLPEGFELTPESSTEVTELMTELNLSQEQAQKVVDKHIKFMGDRDGAVEGAKQNQREDWAMKSRTDKEFGGVNLQENLSGARKAMISFSEPAVDAEGKPTLHLEGAMKGQQMTEIEAVMNESGWGDDPRVIRVFHRINQSLSEDSKFVSGQMKPHEVAKTPAETMYPGMNK